MSEDLPPAWPEQWAPPKLTIAEMLRALRNECDRILVVQQHLIASGARRAPDPVELRRALAMHKAETFLVSCAPYITQIRALIERLRLQGPGR